MSSAQKKEKFFFGGRKYISVICDYCILSKMEADKSSQEGDASDKMQLEIFERLSRFYEANHTLPAHADDDIMDRFRYDCGRDLILETCS